MAREGSVGEKMEMYMSTISIPDIERRRDEVEGL
jgi:hypothetical protein